MKGPLWIQVSAVGQDSHRFVDRPETGSAPAERMRDGCSRVLVLGGLAIPDAPALAGNSDADVLLHALTNALSGLTGKNVLGARADQLCAAGVTDSAAYLSEALNDARQDGWLLSHVSCSLEGRRPRLEPWIPGIRESIARLLNLDVAQIGLTVTSGEGLTGCGRGDGLQAVCLVSAARLRR